MEILQFDGNKAKMRISKRVFQESKASQNFRKRNVCFLETLACFALLKHTF